MKNAVTFGTLLVLFSTRQIDIEDTVYSVIEDIEDVGITTTRYPLLCSSIYTGTVINATEFFLLLLFCL